jgi:hypothetical protein
VDGANPNHNAIINMTRRRGVSLLEVVTVIGISAALMGIAVGLLHTLMRAEETSRDLIVERAAKSRLADQFRRDVRAAESISAPGGQSQTNASAVWELSAGPEQRIQYQAEPRALVRTEREGDKVLRRESFFLPDGAAVSIESAGDADPPIVSLQIIPKAASWGKALWRVDAVLAKDRRFVNQNNP